MEKEVYDIFTFCVTFSAGKDMLVFLEESQSGANHMIMLFLKDSKQKCLATSQPTSLINGLVFFIQLACIRVFRVG